MSQMCTMLCSFPHIHLLQVRSIQIPSSIMRVTHVRVFLGTLINFVFLTIIQLLTSFQDNGYFGLPEDQSVVPDAVRPRETG